MSREVHQIAAVDEWNDFHAGRQDAIVQFLYLGMNSSERVIGIRTLAQKNDPRNDIIVRDDFPVVAMDRARELAEPDLRALGHDSDIPDSKRSAILGRENRVFD